MKAKDWKFISILPDDEDAQARLNACSQFLEKPYEEICSNQGELIVGCFSAGFNRGIAWAEAKYNIKGEDK